MELTAKNLTVEQKVHQMFILGYEGENPLSCPKFVNALKTGLGGVIFFTQNIFEKEKFKNSVDIIKENSLIPPFLSIDQEGGRVERTLNLYGGSHYLSAYDAAQKGEDFVKQQTQWISEELKYFGLNMNFAPVLDVNTTPNNPIIGKRAYSSHPEEVIKFGKIATETYLKNGIIPVGKHFPGHGETTVDSHIEMPELDLPIAELEKIHIKPFKALIRDLPAIMIAHIHYKAFDSQKIPASISQNVIKNYLRKELGFQGLVISDDMVMGGIKKFTSFEACKRAINAGVNMFIYRNSDDATLELIQQLSLAVENGEIDIKLIDESIHYIQSVKNCF